MNKLFNSCLISLFLLLGSFTAVAASLAPEQLIKQVADRVLSDIKQNADRFRADPASLHELVSQIVLPNFDFDAMTDLALGNYRDKISSEQRPLIVNEFRALLVRTYSSALLEYNDQQLTYLPSEGDPASGATVVRTEIEQAGGFPIPIDYSMRKGDEGWKVYDISVDEVSLVTNFRSSFARAIRKDGVDGLITSLKRRNQSQ